jgi:hypothetical protein
MRDLQRQIITYRALRDIPAGEELCKRKSCIDAQTVLTDAGISYGSHLTFKDADVAPPTPPEEEMEQLRMMQPY